jgi:hypothetical protein
VGFGLAPATEMKLKGRRRKLWIGKHLSQEKSNPKQACSAPKTKRKEKRVDKQKERKATSKFVLSRSDARHVVVLGQRRQVFV